MGYAFINQAYVDTIERNYENFATIYETKINKVKEKIKKIYEQGADNFIADISNQISKTIENGIKSLNTDKNVKFNTYINQVYDRIDNFFSDNENMQKFENFFKENNQNIEDEGNEIKKDIDTAILKVLNSKDIGLSQLLKNFTSKENSGLIESQLLGYIKSRIEHFYNKNNNSKEFSRHQSIIFGYIQEDIIQKTFSLAFESIGQVELKARTSGFAQSKIDILVPLTAQSSKKINQNKKTMSQYLDYLDGIKKISKKDSTTFSVEDFIGIQSKPWDLSKKTSEYYQLSLGSRGTIMNQFKKEMGWMGKDFLPFQGAIHLSYKIDDILGPNTIMYYTKAGLIWTSDLLRQLYSQYEKYFAFKYDKDHKELSSHVVIVEKRKLFESLY